MCALFAGAHRAARSGHTVTIAIAKAWGFAPGALREAFRPASSALRASCSRFPTKAPAPLAPPFSPKAEVQSQRLKNLSAKVQSSSAWLPARVLCPAQGYPRLVRLLALAREIAVQFFNLRGMALAHGCDFAL